VSKALNSLARKMWGEYQHAQLLVCQALLGFVLRHLLRLRELVSLQSHDTTRHDTHHTT
jgi:hypothetical protein